MTRRRSLFIVLALVLAASAAAYGLTLRDPGVSVDFFAVGQGDAELIRCGRSEMLIDGGPDLSVLAELGRALPFSDRTIEYLVLTHPHADHLTGLIGVLRRYRVGRVLVPYGIRQQHAAAGFIDAVAANGAELVEVKAGDKADICPSASVAVLWPFGAAPPSAADASDRVNDGSLVLRLDLRGAGSGTAGQRGAALFMSDVGADVERSIIASGAVLRADVIKVGHHGGNGSSSGALLDAVAPEQAVVEVGRNSFGHPAAALISRLESRGIRVRRTDRDGGVRFVFHPTPAVGRP